MRSSNPILALATILVTVVSVSAQDGDSASKKSYRLFGQLTSYLELNQNEDRGDYTKFKQLASFNI